MSLRYFRSFPILASFALLPVAVVVLVWMPPWLTAPLLSSPDELRLQLSLTSQPSALLTPATLARDLNEADIRAAIEDYRRLHGNLG